MEVSVLVEHLAVERVALVISPCDGGAFEQNLVVLAYLNVKTADRTTYRPYGERLILMVARHGGEALGETVANDHVDSDRMHEALHLLRHRGSRRGEYVGML